ncbi:MAG: hypothetical protein CM15mV8_1440 [Caudoviricetes sp.]|nr:MAG: hypothetical protein CM15mV8_1440 [Caudoviricetes sp.]
MENVIILMEQIGEKCLVLRFYYHRKEYALEHLEDDIINRGSDGGRNAVNF